MIWRHGRSEWNVAGRFQGQLDAPLDDVGRSQARAAASSLALLAPAAIVSSDSSRAFDTASELSTVSGVPVVMDPALRELDLGEWSGLTRAEVEARFPEDYASWLAGHDRPGCETYAAAGARAHAAVSRWLDGVGRPLIVVTHGGTGRSLVQALLGLTGQPRSVLAPLGNARWATLHQSSSGGWTLSAYNVGWQPGGDAG